MTESRFPSVSEEECDVLHFDIITDNAFPMADYKKILEDNENENESDYDMLTK